MLSTAQKLAVHIKQVLRLLTGTLLELVLKCKYCARAAVMQLKITTVLLSKPREVFSRYLVEYYRQHPHAV